jgi:rhamnosyltransferase
MSGSSPSIAGTVVLYNPADDVFDNITSYVDQISKLYVIDNSIQYNDTLKQKLDQINKIVYINHGGNKGIAAALNTGAQRALDDGFEFVLTMDQDTSLSKNFVAKLMEALGKNNADQIGIVAPRYLKRLKSQSSPVEHVLFTMTSGNILNLSVYRKIGPFLEALFIDHVDHEYCLRVNQEGYKVLQVNDLEISHRPGSLTKIFNEKFAFSSHSPQRLYYFCRNGFYVANRYRKVFPAFRYFFFKGIVKEICKIAFEKNKMLRIKMITKGFFDFKSSTFGPLRQ